MGLLTEQEKSAMPFDIINKHDDWGTKITIKEKISTSAFRTSSSVIDTYTNKFSVKAIVHDGILLSRGERLKLSKEFIQEGIQNNIDYVVIILLKTLGTNTIEKINKINFNGKDYHIIGLAKYKHEIILTIKNEDI